MKLALSLRNVSKEYRMYSSKADRALEALFPFKNRHTVFRALNKVDLDVSKGEILGIVGHNGAGKSTLLKIISGILSPTSGNLKVNGSIGALIELGSGFNPQFTGRENILFWGSIMGYSKSEIQDLLPQVLEFADIGEFIDHPLKIYSSGMKARLAFALKTCVNPDILIVDEVLSVGDVLFQRKSFARMEKMLQRGGTILFVSHSLPSVAELCTRAILLDRGEVLQSGHPKQIIVNYEKLQFSSKEDAKFLREEFRKEKIVNIPSPKTDHNLETFKSLTPEIIKNDARISVGQFQVFNSEGKPVNCLQMYEIYEISYTLHFADDVEGCIQDIAFRSVRGLKLSHASTAYFPVNQNKFSKGQSLHMRWQFECNLTPSTYFINLAFLKDGELIKKYSDIFAFKVINSSAIKISGLVGLKQKVLFEKVTTTLAQETTSS